MIKLKENLKTKKKYHYIDDKNNIDRLVYEKLNNGKIIFYPFRIKRDNKIVDKYKNIKKIIFDMNEKIPGKGIAKSIRGGYGLTKVMNPLIYFLETKYPGITEIQVSNKSESKIKGKKLTLSLQNYFTFFRSSQSYNTEEKERKELFVNNFLSGILPHNFSKRKRLYTDGTITRYIDKLNNIKLSKGDQKILLKLLSETTIEESSILLKSKDIISEKYIEEVIEEYQELLKQKTNTNILEKKRQKFFKQHNWIFSQILALPVVYFEDEAYIGGKGIKNKGGKVIDFLYKNNLTSNLVLVEVKTHKTQIFNRKPFRGDDVFGYNNEYSGAISQLLDQKHNLLREYTVIASKSDEYFEVFDPYCILIAGNFSDLTTKQKKCFSLMRNNNRNIISITYDELLDKIKLVLGLFKT